MSETTYPLEDRLRATLETVAELPAGSLETDVDVWPTTPNWRRGGLIATGLAAAVALVVAAVLMTSSDSGHGPAALRPGAVRLIAQASAVGLESGTAHLKVVQSYTGSPQSRQVGRAGSEPHVFAVLPTTNTWSVDMAFTAQNLAERVTQSVSAPTAIAGSNPGTASSSTYEMALVDGVMYRQISGTWYSESASAATALLVVPTPKTFLAALSPAAELIPEGKDAATGWEEIQAQKPQAAAPALNRQTVGLAGGTVSSLTIWVDRHNVVQQMAWTTTSPQGGATCITPRTPSHTGGPANQDTRICLPGLSETETVEITFAAIGVPQLVTAPAEARPGYGPFDEPNN